MHPIVFGVPPTLHFESVYSVGEGTPFLQYGIMEPPEERVVHTPKTTSDAWYSIGDPVQVADDEYNDTRSLFPVAEGFEAGKVPVTHFLRELP